MAANVGDQRAADWSSQYSMVTGNSRENGMETPMHENPEWEKARQALASISKAGATSSSKASSSGPVASAQYVSQAEASALQQQQQQYYQWYQQYNYAYPYSYYYPMSMYQSYGSPSQYGMASSYGSATAQQPSAPQHQGTLNQPPVPGMDESMAYQASPQQLPAAQPPQPQSQRGTPGAGGAGRARGSSFTKFGNRNVFMKDNSSSSSTDSRSRSSSRSPTRHFRRSDSHSDSDSSYSGNECHPVGRRNPPPKGRGGRGAHMDRGRGRAQRGKRHDLAPTKRSRKKMAALECEDPERELKKQKRAARFQHGHSRRLRLEPLVLQMSNLESSGADPDWQELQIVGTCPDITKHYLRLTCAPDPSTVRPVAQRRLFTFFEPWTWVVKICGE